jgi:hypothetical protein
MAGNAAHHLASQMQCIVDGDHLPRIAHLDLACQHWFCHQAYIGWLRRIAGMV